MSIEAMKQALEELEYVLDCINQEKIPFDGDDFHETLRNLRQAIEQAEKQEPAVEHLWECLGRWSSYLAVNGTEANLAPPNWLLDAVIAATSPPRKEWVGLTGEDLENEFGFIDELLRDHAYRIEAKLRSKNYVS